MMPRQHRMRTTRGLIARAGMAVAVGVINVVIALSSLAALLFAATCVIEFATWVLK